MAVYKDVIKVSTLEGKPTYLDVTEGVENIVKASGIK